MTIRYTPTHSLPYPEGSDSVAPASRDFRDLAAATDAALTNVLVEASRSFDLAATLTSTDNLDQVDDNALHYIQGGSKPATAPAGADSGFVWTRVADSGKFVRSQTYYEIAGDRRVWSRTRSGSNPGSWTAWKRQDPEAALMSATLTASDNINNISTDSLHYVFSGNAPAGWPREVGSGFVVTRVTYSGDGGAYVRHQEIREVGGANHTWVRTRSGSNPGSWGEWRRDSMERIVPHPLSRAKGTHTETTTSRSVRIPFTVPVNARRWRIVLRNANYRMNTLYPGAVTIRTATFGEAVRDTAGELTSAFTAAPWILWRGQGIPNAANTWRSPWVYSSLEPGRDYLLALGYQTDGQEVTLNMGGGWWTNGTPMNAEITTDTTATWTPNLPFDLRLEMAVAEETAVDVYIGDSIGGGSNTTLAVHDAPPAFVARDSGRVIMQHAFGGAGMTEWTTGTWTDPASIKWADVTSYGRASRAFIALGNNDINGGMNLTTLKSRFTTLVNLVRERVSADVIACTVTPRTAWTGTPEATRVAFNDWLRTYPAGITGVADMARVMESPGDPSTPRPEFDDDGIHPTTAGSAALAGAITRPVATAAGAGGQDTGWQSLTLAPTQDGDDYGHIRRTGNLVTVHLSSIEVATNGHVTIATIPVGFRPAPAGPGPGANWRNGQVMDDTGTSIRHASYFNGDLRILNAETGKSYGGTITWITDDPWPTTLPGTPA